MKIEILGSGCWKCKQLEENTRKALQKLGIKADIVKITDIDKIIEHGVMSTPAIAIDGKVVASGRVFSPEELTKHLK